MLSLGEEYFIAGAEAVERTREQIGLRWRESRFGPHATLRYCPPVIELASASYQAATLTFSVATDSIVFRICEAIW